MRDLLLDGLEEGYFRKAWHGPTLRGALRGVGAKEAAWRPAPGRHSIWDLVIHCAYWKYTVRRKLTGGKRATFARAGSTWFVPPEPTERAWKADLQLLAGEHLALREAVASLPKSRLERSVRIIRGAAYHDVYHAGQIRLLRRLFSDR